MMQGSSRAGDSEMERVSTLANGLRVASSLQPHAETISVGIWVNIGARHESETMNGVTHLLEHMLFKGTKRRSAQQIAEEIESVGGHINAYTGYEQTAYYCRILYEDLPLALDILSDIIQNSQINPEELERERAVVLQEIGQSIDTPDDIIFDHFQATAYPGQSIGRAILGTSETVSALSRDALQAHISAHYTAPHMVLCAAGRIEHESLTALVADFLGDLPKTTFQNPSQACYKGGWYRQEKELEQVHFLLGFESVGYCHPDFYTYAVLSTILGGGMSSRLFQEIRERRGLVYALHSFNSSFSDSGLFGIYAGTGGEGIAELVPCLCEELRRALDHISEAEIARARAQIRAGLRMTRESVSGRCEQLAQQIQIHGRPIPMAELLDQVDNVTAPTLYTVLEKMLTSSPNMAAIGPLAQLPPSESVISWLAGETKIL